MTLVTFLVVAALYAIGLINGRAGFLLTTSSQVNYSVMLGIHGLPLRPNLVSMPSSRVENETSCTPDINTIGDGRFDYHGVHDCSDTL